MRRQQSEDDDLGRTRTRNIHRSNGAALGSGVNAMKLNRKTEPLVYKRVAFRTTLLDEQKRRSQALMDIAIGIYGFAFIVFLFAWLG